MITGYEECPDRDPRPSLWRVLLEVSLIVGLARMALLWGAG
ncbi:MAG TPA: hypothetical protein VNK52_12540 [Hyphomicrobiaceae bacterium]|nr:hypothetical protein [Hyphomicrobiaceae bacterium]